MSEATDLGSALQALWLRARPVIDEQLTEIEDVALAMLESRAEEPAVRAAERDAHKIAGSAGTFGYHRATDIAREIERILGTEVPSPAVGQNVAGLVEALRTVLTSTPKAGSHAEAARDGDALLIVHPDPGRAEKLSVVAARRGLRPVVPAGLADTRTPVAAAVVDFAGEQTVELIAELARQNPRSPLFVLSSADHLLDRVATARAGASGFLPTGLADEEIISAVVDSLQRKAADRPWLLAVDDDPVVRELLQQLFADADISVTTLADPLQFWDALQQHAPDLVLLDVDMPEVTGLELCRLLRADQRWASLPVLVLTGRTAAVQEVFAAGADDYVPKPVVGPELLTRVTNRLERVRLYRQLADTDNLTGLANRRRFSADFERLRRVADRYGQPLSFALLDLDNFKRINDRYGHVVGDTVLQRLAALLSQQFRSEDIVGRWGGEEIALGLHGMARTDGVARVATALEAMREEVFTAPGLPPLRVTFSAGVAEYGPDGGDLHGLYQAADTALYQAKASGRDRVLPAGWRDTGKRAASVLVVEDDPALTQLLEHSLATRGLRHLSVADGPAAVAMLTAPDGPRPSVILLDVDLPGLNGLDVLGELQRAEVLARSKVIMLTGRAGEAEVLAAFDRGAFDHVAKPFSVPVLMQRVRRALAASA